MEELLNKIIDLRTKQNEKMIISHGKVTKVRENECDVQRPQMTDLLNVRFHSIISDTKNYIRIIPKQGSDVLCGIIENNISEAVILAYSEIDKVIITIDEAEFIMYNGKFTIKNNEANLKSIFNNSFETLINATILTPTGPGHFSPNDKKKFTDENQKINKLFH